MQRYRNNRRTSSGAKMQQLVGVQLAPGIGNPTPSSTVDLVREECEEGIEALQKLFDSRAVESLLDQTRPHRASWLQTAVSIHTVLQTYPVLKHPKWVCLCECLFIITLTCFGKRCPKYYLCEGGGFYNSAFQ